MLIHSISKLATISGAPQRGSSMGRLNIIENSAVLIRDGKIADIGESKLLEDKYQEDVCFNAAGKALMPGFVDCHTHAVWAGHRAEEFALKLEGKSYLEILQNGGGILSTVRKTRHASLDELITESQPRLETMFAHGTTTAEVKTGYGLDIDTEIKMLEAILLLDQLLPIKLVPTFLGAHAVPSDSDAASYTSLICQEMLPAVKSFWEKKQTGAPLPFVDVFCETGAFNLSQTEKILQKAISLGFPVKIHVDEFDNLKGASLAAELGAVSADHLVVTSEEDMSNLGASETVAVSLPGTPFGLGHHEYTPANRLLAKNAILAVGSDLNPGTSWCENIQMTLAIACRYLKITPAQAIVATTINAAAALKLQNSIGSLEIGKEADLLVLSKDDFEQIGYRYGTNLVETIIKSGEIQ